MTDLLSNESSSDPSIITDQAHYALVRKVSTSYRESGVARVVVDSGLHAKVFPDLRDHAQLHGGDVIPVTSMDALAAVQAPNLGLLVLGTSVEI